ncbi:MAG: carbohydrate porin [Pseudomonadota bacterium]
MRDKLFLISVAYMLALTPQWCAALQLPNRNQGQETTDDPFRSGQRGGPVLSPVENTRRPQPPPEPPPQPIPAPPATQAPPPMLPTPKRSAITVARPPQPPGDFGYSARLTTDILTRIAGGDPAATDSGATPGLGELTWGGDTRAAGLWENGQIKMHLMYSFGDSPAKFGDALQPVSAVDDGQRAFNILEVWYEHYFEYNNTWLRGGILEYNRDFYRTPYVNDLFLNRALHIGAETGNLYLHNQPAISMFPLTSAGLFGKTHFSPHIYLQAAIFDGATGPKSVQYAMPKSDGYFVAAELGWRGDVQHNLEGSKFALGGWLVLKNIDNWLGQRSNSGTYAERYLTQPAFAKNPRRSVYAIYALASMALGEHVHIFAHAAQSDPEVNRFAMSASGGIIVKGLVPGRTKDFFGAGIAYTQQSSTYVNAYNDILWANPDPDFTCDPDPLPCGIYSEEYVYEISYSLNFGSWLTLQPNYQWIIRPGTDPYLGNLSIAGLRTRFSF